MLTSHRLGGDDTVTQPDDCLPCSPVHVRTQTRMWSTAVLHKTLLLHQWRSLYYESSSLCNACWRTAQLCASVCHHSTISPHTCCLQIRTGSTRLPIRRWGSQPKTRPVHSNQHQQPVNSFPASCHLFSAHTALWWWQHWFKKPLNDALGINPSFPCFFFSHM